MADKNASRISLHVRVWTTLLDAAQEAIALDRSYFQSFLISQTTGRSLVIGQQERDDFVVMRMHHFSMLFAHAAYWINLASCQQRDTMPFLYKEVEMARSLTFTHYIMHAGTALGCADRLQGIENVARRLNKLMRRVSDIKFVLENGAHANKAVCTQLHEFGLLLNKLDYPDKILFCLDTAHAYVAGYDITTELGYEQMLSEVMSAVGFERMALIHLNDTAEALGSYHDRHVVPGTGRIGVSPLQVLVQDQRLAHVPCVLEMPPQTQDEEREVLARVESWLT